MYAKYTCVGRLSTWQSQKDSGNSSGHFGMRGNTERVSCLKAELTSVLQKKKPKKQHCEK